MTWSSWSIFFDAAGFSDGSAPPDFLPDVIQEPGLNQPAVICILSDPDLIAGFYAPAQETEQFPIFLHTDRLLRVAGPADFRHFAIHLLLKTHAFHYFRFKFRPLGLIGQQFFQPDRKHLRSGLQIGCSFFMDRESRCRRLTNFRKKSDSSSFSQR